MGSESPSSLELDRKRLCDRVAPVTDLEEEREEERDVRFMLSWVIQGADDASCSGLRGSYLGGVNDIEMTSRGSLFVSICSTEKNVLEIFFSCKAVQVHRVDVSDRGPEKKPRPTSSR